MATLPEDLVIEILSKLPAESVLRFEYVCKSWYALINDPKFVTKHFCNSLHHNRIVLMRNGASTAVEFIIYSFEEDGSESESVSDFHFPYDGNFPRFNLCGHSHGLICLANVDDIFLCNPTTREFRNLSPSILHPIEPPGDPNAYHLYNNVVGFGYDPKSKDFKVVRVAYSFQYVEIYELSKDRWREIETTVYPLVTTTCDLYNRGSYYWWAQDAEEVITIILSFDMSEEVFTKILVPEELDYYRSRMGVLNGSIVALHYPWGGDGDAKTFHVWEMAKDGFGGVSWSKLFAIVGPVSGIIEKPLLFVSSDELLLEAEEGQICLYNIRTQRLKELPIKGMPIKGKSPTLITKSLVSVTGGRNIKMDFSAT